MRARRRRMTRTAKSVLTPRLLASSCVVAHRIERDIHAVTVAIKPFTGESAK